jgi:hypothetical protein
MIKIDPLMRADSKWTVGLRTKYPFPLTTEKTTFGLSKIVLSARTRATEMIAPATVGAALAIYTRSVTASVAEGNFLLGILRIPKFKTVRQGKHSSLGGLLWNTFSGS